MRKSSLSIFVFFVGLASVEALPNLFQYELKKAEHLVSHFEIPSDGVKEPFSWKDCSSVSSVVSIKSLSITPDPLSFPGPLDISTDFSLKKSLASPLKAELTVKKKILGTYIEIPCIDNVGSCTYDDLCQLLSQIPPSQCPDPLKKAGINCACPLKQNSYSLQKAEFDISASIIPSGEYHVVVNVTESGEEVVCLDMYLTIQ